MLPALGRQQRSAEDHFPLASFPRVLRSLFPLVPRWWFAGNVRIAPARGPPLIPPGPPCLAAGRLSLFLDHFFSRSLIWSTDSLNLGVQLQPSPKLSAAFISWGPERITPPTSESWLPRYRGIISPRPLPVFGVVRERHFVTSRLPRFVRKKLTQPPLIPGLAWSFFVLSSFYTKTTFR